MTQEKTEFHTLLQDTPLADTPIARIAIPGSTEEAIALDLPPGNPMKSWSVLRKLVPQTGRWPLLVTLWGGGSSWDGKVEFMREELFSRADFAHDRLLEERGGDAPSDIIEASASVDVDELLRRFDPGRGDVLDLEDDLVRELEATRARCGSAPHIDEPVSFLLDEEIFSRKDLERWLFLWEYRNHPKALGMAQEEMDYLQWFLPHSPSLGLVLMPSARYWEIPAYIHWFTAQSFSSQLVVALLREWHLRYGAELVAHHGTMLELSTARLPTSPEEAFHLAWQQETIAQGTTLKTGISLRDHARALMHTRSWFLHQRP